MPRPRRRVVTNATFGDLVIEGLREAVAVARGEATPARERVLDARDLTVAPPPSYDAARIQRVRKRLGLSQQLFADVLNVSASTVRAWEQGARVPDGPSLRLLELAERRPDALLLSVEPAAVATP